MLFIHTLSNNHSFISKRKKILQKCKERVKHCLCKRGPKHKGNNLWSEKSIDEMEAARNKTQKPNAQLVISASERQH